MRTPAPDDRPIGLTIAGSDSGGGAGIQADLKTMEACGLFGTSVVTSVTAQNSTGVESTHVLPTEEVTAQFDAVVSDFEVRAAKTGMLATEPIVTAVTDRATGLEAPLVVDPVMVAASGDRLLDPAAESAYESLIAEAALVTPNRDEAEVLTGDSIEDADDAAAAGRALLDLGVDAALVKGGHLPGEEVHDVLVTENGTETLSNPRIDTEATHGSGCALSSAIVAGLARGRSLEEAVEYGVEFMQRAVRYHLDVGKGPGSVHHMAGVRERAARGPTAARVDEVVDRLVAEDVSGIVPEVGMNVVGATPYAEEPTETAAVEGRITRTMNGVRPNRGVRFGASSHVARFLLSARELDPTLRFAANCRFDGPVEDALGDLDGAVVEVDRREEPDPDAEGRTMGWIAREAFEQADGTPVAIFDRGDVGKEAMTRLLAGDHRDLVERCLTVRDAL